MRFTIRQIYWLTLGFRCLKTKAAIEESILEGADSLSAHVLYDVFRFLSANQSESYFECDLEADHEAEVQQLSNQSQVVFAKIINKSKDEDYETFFDLNKDVFIEVL